VKAAVNYFLRLGLMQSGKRQQKKFIVHPRPLGLPHDDVEELMETLEGAGHDVHADPD
jgi:hypothetical protein